jgi:two-component system, LytTR family, response regulator AlgR
MRCLIVDDESLARQRLARLVEGFAGEVCGHAQSGEEALQQVERLQPDLVLMDIRMPGMDGLEAARHLAGFDKPPAVIFTTAYGDHALEAFDAHAIDYLLKPIHPERLHKALTKAMRLSETQLETLQDVGGNGARTHICARNRGNLELVPVEEVVFFQADCKYVTVCSPRQRILIEEPLKALEQEFAETFIRIHRNALISVNAIRGLEKVSEGQYRVMLEGVEERLEVSRRLLPDVKRRIKSGS